MDDKMHSTKMDILQNLIEMMDKHMLGGLKKKGEKPAPAAVEVTMEAEPTATDKAEHTEGKEPDGDEADSDLMKKLVDHYSKDGKDEDDDDLTPEIAIPMG